MKQFKWTLLLALGVGAPSFVQAQKIEERVVFAAGQEGYASYRIPAIVRTEEGDLLAFCEGRVADSNDYGNIDIVIKRSRDGGRTWGALQKLVDNGVLQAGNPAPVIDKTDPRYPKGRIFLFYNTGNNHEGAVRKGKGVREVWYITSEDQGQTWSEPVNITTQVHRPLAPDFRSDYTFKEDWRGYANTPGHAMQFDEGKFKGRIFVAGNYSFGDPQPSFKDYRAFGFYSDDHGESFHLGAAVSAPGANESMAAQIDGDRLLMNSRNQQGQVRSRIVSISKDGGASWDTTFYDAQLPDPVNQGSVLSWKDEERLLAFCNTASVRYRDSLTLRISRDNGKTWFYKHLLAAAPKGYKGAWAAYSDLVYMNDARVGVLFEKDDYKTIVWTVVAWQ